MYRLNFKLLTLGEAMLNSGATVGAILFLVQTIVLLFRTAPAAARAA